MDMASKLFTLHYITHSQLLQQAHPTRNLKPLQYVDCWSVAWDLCGCMLIRLSTVCFSLSLFCNYCTQWLYQLLV